jgi:hypothetical protein
MSTGVLTICFGTALALAVFARRKDPVKPTVKDALTGFLLGLVFGFIPANFVMPVFQPHLEVAAWFSIALGLACAAILCSTELDKVRQKRVFAAVLLTWASFALIGE